MTNIINLGPFVYSISFSGSNNFVCAVDGERFVPSNFTVEGEFSFDKPYLCSR